MLKAIGKFSSWIRYGNQIGVTAKNGTKLYGYGKINRTAIDADGNIIRKTRKNYYSGNPDKYVTTYYPDGCYAVTEITRSESDDGSIGYNSKSSFFDKNGNKSYASSQKAAGKVCRVHWSFNPITKRLSGDVDRFSEVRCFSIWDVLFSNYNDTYPHSFCVKV